jgi:hypothetical protein
LHPQKPATITLKARFATTTGPDGFIDIACIFETPEISADIGQFIIDEREEQLVWVRMNIICLRCRSSKPCCVHGPTRSRKPRSKPGNN